MAALLYSAFWSVIANRALDALDAWASRERQRGHAVDWKSVEMSGYPFRLIARLDQPGVLAVDGEASRWEWHAETATLSGVPWSWNSIRIDLSGRHSVTVFQPGEATGQLTVLDAHALRIDAGLDEGIWHRISWSASDLQIVRKNRVISKVSEITGELTRESIPGADERTRTGGLTFEIRDLDAPILGSALIRAAGSFFRLVSLDAEIYGPSLSNLTEPALTVWRDAGGVVEVRRVRADYGPLALDAEGTLALDGQMQPVDSFTAVLIGFSEAVDGLHGAGIISDGNALTAKLVLGVMAKKDRVTGQTRLPLPINIQDRTVYAGPLALARIPHIQW